MKAARLPDRERERLQALRDAAILDTPPEADFDALTRIAAAICGTPIALVSLLDADRQWFKSRVGVVETETSRDDSFGAHAILEPDLMEVRDAQADPRFADNPHVIGRPHVRFYAGTPLRTADGHVLGTLCVIDHVPRSLTGEQRSALRDLGQQAMAQIEIRRTVAELRRAVAERESAEGALRRALDTAIQLPPAPASTAPSARPGALALAALMVPLMLTLAGAQISRDRLERRREERFARSVEQIADGVAERVSAYEQVLRGGAALFAVTPDVRRDQWQAYVDGLGIAQRYPGIRALGYIPRLRRADIPAFEARLRKEGLSLPVRPLAGSADVFPVLYVEPMENNRSAIAFDVGSEPRRRAAAETARDEGRTVMTSELALVQDPEQASGFLVFAPVYARGADRRTLEGRRDGLTGWVYTAARARDVIGALAVPVAPELELEVYDGISPRPEALLYDSAPPARGAVGGNALSRVRAVTVAGRPWTLRVSALPPFDAEESSWEPNVILAGGGLGSLLIFGFVWSLADARRGAIERVDRITGALRASEQRVRSVMDTVADAIITFGRDSKVQSANPAAEWLFGRRLADLIGRDVGELIPGLVPAPSGQIEAEARRADDSTVPVDVAVTPAAGGDSFVASVRDVSERRAAEQALRQSEQRTRSILDNMLGGLITIDAEANIESANPAAGKIFGYEPAELVGKPLALLVPESVGDRAGYLRTAFARAIGRITEWRGRRGSGEEFPFELSMFEFTGGGGGRHFAGSVRDVSERHAVEKLKGEFISTVSHELRTPLASIRGSLSLLAGGVLGDLSDEAREMVVIAERNCVRLIGLVNDILDLERLEQGRLHMEMGEVDMADVFKRTREAVQAFAAERQVAVETAATTVTVQGDGGRLVQVLVNLVSNAVKFSPSGAAVRVTVGETNGRVRTSVIDRGRGIPASHRSVIFERFRQVESSDARDKGGTGLGLAICKAIVEQHGGEIGVESEVGHGSTFWFEVPSTPAADRFLEMFRVADGRPDVLLADHDATLLGVLVRQLVGDGVRVRVAFDAAEAEQAIREAAPRLLVVDLGLPEGEGRRLLDHLRTEERLSLMPLLVYSARDVDERLLSRLALGPTRFLTKSRATDVEVRTVVSQMLGAEAREAQL
jgi:PAS domain S-box-containing protein